MDIFIGKLYSKVKMYFQNKRYQIFRNKYNIHPNFKFNGFDISFYGDGNIVCGQNSYIGSYSTLQCSENQNIIIGKKVRISHNVRIYTESNIPDQDFSNAYLITKKGDVVIGDYTWVGANVFINPGITIGDNSVIGANSVVTKDILKDGIYGGVPAKLIRLKVKS